ncbi:MAG: hypothetical protein RL376_753 [Verrucomicrobiota bacterium]|jgi:predicted MFS family arabinose efflux permease
MMEQAEFRDRLGGQLCAAIQFVLTAQSLLMIPMLPAFAERHGQSGGQVTLILVVYAVVMGVGTGLMGPLSDRLGRKKMIFAGSALTGLCLAGHFWAHDFATLLVLRALTAVGHSVLIGSFTCFVADRFPSAQRVKANGRIQLGYIAGQTAGVSAGLFLLERLGPEGVLGAWGLILLPLSLAFGWWVGPERGEAAAPATVRLRWSDHVEAWRGLSASFGTVSTLAAYGLMFVAAHAFLVVFPLWGHDRLAFNSETLGFVFLAGGIVQALFLVVPGTPRFSKRHGSLIVGSLRWSGFVVMAAALWPAAAGVIIGVYLMVSALLAVRMGPLQVGLSSVAARYHRGTWMGWVQSSGQAGRAAGAWLGGVSYTVLGVRAVFVIAAALFIVSALLFARGRALKDTALPEVS